MRLVSAKVAARVRPVGQWWDRVNTTPMMLKDKAKMKKQRYTDSHSHAVVQRVGAGSAIFSRKRWAGSVTKVRLDDAYATIIKSGWSVSKLEEVHTSDEG